MQHGVLDEVISVVDPAVVVGVLVLLKNTTLSCQHGLHTSPEGLARVRNVAPREAVPLFLNGGLQAGHAVVGSGTGSAANVVPDAEVKGVQIARVGWPNSF